jgi:hypothetical protein
MPDEFDSLLQRLTHRLRFDPELRLQIQRELRGHLQDNFNEHRAAGLSEEESRTKAVAALGDANELEQKLWTANRRRMTLRAILRWMAATCLAPAACLACIFMVLGIVRSYSPIDSIAFSPLDDLRNPPGRWVPGLTKSEAQRFDAAPPDVKWALLPAEDAWNYRTVDLVLPGAKTAAEQHPDDRALVMDYAARFVDDLRLQYSGYDEPLLDASKLHEAISIIHHGEAIDPDNAVYPLLASQCLARASSRQMRDQPANYFPYSVLYASGKIEHWNAWKLKIEDPVLFNQAVEEFELATTKADFTSYCNQLDQRRIALLPAGDDLGDQFMRMATAAFSQHGSVLYWDLMFTMSARALDLAVAGKRDESLRLGRIINQVAAKVAGKDDDGTFWSVFYATDIAGHAAAVLELAGKTAEASERKWMLQADRRRHRIFPANASVGLVDSSDNRSAIADWVSRHMHVPSNVGPLRTAEYSLTDMVGLLSVVAGLLTILLVSAVGAGIERLAARRRNEPAVAILPQAREVFGLVLLALALPVLVYATYVRFIPAGQRALGVNVRSSSLAMEYIVLTAATAMIALAASAQVARRHLAAMGADSMGLIAFAPAESCSCSPPRSRCWLRLLGFGSPTYANFPIPLREFS